MKYTPLLLVVLLCSSCWRMPKEGDVSTLPMTNNPSLIHQSGGGASSVPTPGVEY